MELKEQSYMLAIEQYEGIKSAAESLHISPPALSVFLSNLESRIGARLFDRLGKRFIPTEIGKLYLKNAKEMMRIREQYELELAQHKNGTAGTVRFGIHPRRTLNLLAPVLTQFAIKYPEVQVFPFEGSSPRMYELLLDGELDFIIVNYVNNDPHLKYLPLYQDKLVVVLSDSYSVAEQSVLLPNQTIPWIDLSHFNGERFILQKPDQSSRFYEDQAIAWSQAKPGQIFIIENLESACQMAAEGYGIAFTFEHYIRHFSYKKNITYYLAGDVNLAVNYYIVSRDGKFIPDYTHELIDIIKRYC